MLSIKNITILKLIRDKYPFELSKNDKGYIIQDIEDVGYTVYLTSHLRGLLRGGYCDVVDNTLVITEKGIKELDTANTIHQSIINSARNSAYHHGYTDASFGKDKSNEYAGMNKEWYEEGRESFFKEFKDTGV